MLHRLVVDLLLSAERRVEARLLAWIWWHDSPARGAPREAAGAFARMRDAAGAGTLDAEALALLAAGTLGEVMDL